MSHAERCSRNRQRERQTGERRSDLFVKSILMTTDGSDEAGQATQAATKLSKGTGSEVRVVHTLPTPARPMGHHLYSDEVRESLVGGAETFLKEHTEKVGADGEKRAETHLRSGDPDKEILQGDPPHGRGARRDHDSDRHPRLRRGKQDAAGQRFRSGCAPRSLPGVRSARGQDGRLPERVVARRRLGSSIRPVTER